MDIDRAIEYVQSRGDVVERSRLAAILFDRPAGPYTLRQMDVRQAPDGGFAVEGPACSTVSATVHALYHCDDLHIRQGTLVQAACLFLLQRRCLDGGWDEVAAVRSASPPPWLAPGRLETRLWLTGCCAHVLMLMGFAPNSTDHSPSRFLTAFQDELGLIGGDLLTTWVALPSLAHDPGPASVEYRQALSACDSHYTGQESPSFTAWMLRCLRDAAVPVDHPLVGRALESLARTQRSDGGWASADENGNGAGATVQVLGAFQGYGLIHSAPPAPAEAPRTARRLEWQPGSLAPFLPPPKVGAEVGSWARFVN